MMTAGFSIGTSMNFERLFGLDFFSDNLLKIGSTYKVTSYSLLLIVININTRQWGFRA